MRSFILAMVLYPEVQKLAQAEIDAVVGQDQFPTFGDRDKLPYIEALALELFRWGLVSPQGQQHDFCPTSCSLSGTQGPRTTQ
jgi:hypothetical protein